MPVKVRCPDCEKVLNAPDKAMGKSLKCPHCEGRIRVPMKKKKRRPAGSADAAPKRRRPKRDADDLFGGIDLRNAEDERTKLCPKCTKIIVDEDEIECPYCGTNIETGGLSEKQRKRRARGGPDPDDYFDKVWKGCKAFLKKNRPLVINSAISWAIALTLCVLCYRCSHYCYVSEYTDIYAQAGNGNSVQVTATAVIIDGTPDRKATYRDTKYTRRVVLPGPSVQAIRAPSTLFWMALGTVCLLSAVGWGVFLTVEVVKATLNGEKKMDRVQSDFFGNVTQGIKFFCWPLFIYAPLSIAPAAIALGAASTGGGLISPTAGIIIGVTLGAFYFLALPFAPAAAVHMAQKHTYPAWLLTRVAKSTFKSMSAALTMAGLLFACLLIPLGFFGILAAAGGPVRRLWNNILGWVADQIGYGAGPGLLDLGVELILLALVAALLIVPLFLAFSFPMIYTMRAIGLYGLYFKDELELQGQTTAFEPVGFGPRYLAYCVDHFILQLVVLLASALQYACTFLGPTGVGLMGVIGLAQLAFGIYYWVGSESGQARATPGKWSLGLIVVDENNEMLTRGHAFKRALCAYLSAIMFYIGFLMCIFDPDKRALHDKISRTKVCWKGDDEMLG